MDLHNLRKIIRMKRCDKNKILIKKTYVVIGALGIFLLLIAVLPLWKIVQEKYCVILSNDMLNNILISLGSGLITSVIVTMLCEQANERVNIKQKELMKSNILMDFTELINFYFNDELEYINLKNVLNNDFFANANVKINQYILLGIMFYNEDEFRYLNNLQGYSNNLCETIRENNIKNLYDEYSEIFDDALGWDFSMRLYSNEKKIFKICKVLKKPISTINACKISEFIFIYLTYIKYIKDFQNVFNYIKSDE
ncbi:hypothetical protein FC959_03485 [Clostridium botulinum]|nr:hypothetical protein [Clostridium botulinum]